jgi:phosphoserine aminotransferase
MNRHTPITIPSHLLPRDGRFGSGPSRVEPLFVGELAESGSGFLGTSHRKAGVRNVVRSIQDGISALYELPDGYEVVLGVGGATSFWDAAAFGLVTNRSAHFVCGEFSEKFAIVTAGAPHLDDPVVISAPYGSAPEPRDVKDVDVAGYIHNETSTGVKAPFSRNGEALVLVDGTSAAGAIPFDVPTIDAYYFSPQKAFGSDGGLWLSIMSPAAIARIETIAASQRWIPPFLSLAGALANSRKNQTYNTPALATLFLLERQISSGLSSGGLGALAQRSLDSSQHLYDWAEARPFTTPFVSSPSLRSPTVVTIDLDGSVPAGDVISVLETYGIVDIGGYRKLGRNQLRIATFPNIPTSDVEALTACIDFVVEAL